MDGLIIRKATIDDTYAKAFVHYTSWIETYTGLMPEEYLEKLSFQRCQRIAEQFPENTLLAEVDGNVIGYACYLSGKRNVVSVDDSNEIIGIYLLKDYKSKGIGKALLNECINLLPAEKIVLYVLSNNLHAIEFFIRQGFSFTGKKIFQDVPGGIISEAEMVFTKNRG